VPIHYTIDTVRGLVRVEMRGVVGPGETVEFLERLASDASLGPAMPQLVDFTRVHAPPSAAESESVAQQFSRLRHRFQGARCAVVVADPLMYGAIRQFAALAARALVEVRPFLDPAEAERWLGMPMDLQ
jgi:hypothetical protein